MDEKEKELARKCLQKIRSYHKCEVTGWKIRARNDAYLLLRPKLDHWIYNYFYKKFITLSDDKKMSLGWECFADVIDKFDVGRSKQPVLKFFPNMHQLILYRCAFYYTKWLKRKEFNSNRNEKIDPDDIPEYTDNNLEFTIDFQEFRDRIEDPMMKEVLDDLLSGNLKKFSGNVYFWGKQRSFKIALINIIKYLCTENKWGKPRGSD